jgi:two-component system KDP operon response regulator KdpE
MAACRQIRAVSEVAHIVLSVRGAEKDRITAVDAGADDYITNPFSVNELRGRIRAKLRRLFDQTSATVVSDNHIIDFAARQVTAHGQKIRLTPKEFDLILSNANKPLTHRKWLQNDMGAGVRR